MNIFSICDYKGERIIKISINILREFENINMEDRIANSNLNNLGDVFSKPKIKKLLEIR